MSVGSNAGLVRYGGVSAQNGTLTATLGTLTLNPFATLTIAKPLTPSYTTAPTDAQIGYIYTYPAISTTAFSTAAGTQSQSQTAALGTATTGVWLANASCMFWTTGTTTLNTGYIAIAYNSVDQVRQGNTDVLMNQTNDKYDLPFSTSAVIYGNSNLISFKQYANFSGTVLNVSGAYYKFTLTRIA